MATTHIRRPAMRPTPDPPVSPRRTGTDEGSRRLFDCPLCGQAGRVDLHGLPRVSLRCFAACPDDRVARRLDLRELVAIDHVGELSDRQTLSIGLRDRDRALAAVRLHDLAQRRP